MPQHQILTGKAFEFQQELVRQTGGPKAIDIGVGDNLCNATGRDPQTIANEVHMVVDKFINGGCNVGVIFGVKFFGFRRGNSIEVGTRKDFKAVGWDTVCDEAEKDQHRFDARMGVK